MITRKDVKYISDLSRIHLTDDEAEKLTKSLEGILHYIEKLNTLDVSNVQPTSHVLPITNVFREDTVIPSLPQDKALSVAVEKHNGSFKVPKVIE